MIISVNDLHRPIIGRPTGQPKSALASKTVPSTQCFTPKCPLSKSHDSWTALRPGTDYHMIDLPATIKKCKALVKLKQALGAQYASRKTTLLKQLLTAGPLDAVAEALGELHADGFFEDADELAAWTDRLFDMDGPPPLPPLPPLPRSERQASEQSLVSLSAWDTADESSSFASLLDVLPRLLADPAHRDLLAPVAPPATAPTPASANVAHDYVLGGGSVTAEGAATAAARPAEETGAADAPTPRSALCIVPPPTAWGPLQALREALDPAWPRWPPHINLVWPFVPEAAFHGLLPRLRAAVAGIGSHRGPNLAWPTMVPSPPHRHPPARQARSRWRSRASSASTTPSARSTSTQRRPSSQRCMSASSPRCRRAPPRAPSHRT